MPGSREDHLWAARAGVCCTTIWRWRKAGLFTPEIREAIVADYVRERELRARARSLGLAPRQVSQRVKRGWSLERACTTPLLKHGYNVETHANRAKPRPYLRAQRSGDKAA